MTELHQLPTEEQLILAGLLADAKDEMRDAMARNLAVIRSEFHLALQNVANVHNECESLRQQLAYLAEQMGNHLNEIKVYSDALIKAVVSGAVSEMLKNAVLVTRPATREEIKSGDAIPIRQVTPSEMRKEKFQVQGGRS